jgi:hypothetical protein
MCQWLSDIVAANSAGLRLGPMPSIHPAALICARLTERFWSEL